MTAARSDTPEQSSAHCQSFNKTWLCKSNAITAAVVAAAVVVVVVPTVVTPTSPVVLVDTAVVNTEDGKLLSVSAPRLVLSIPFTTPTTTGLTTVGTVTVTVITNARHLIAIADNTSTTWTVTADLSTCSIEFKRKVIEAASIIDRISVKVLIAAASLC